VAGTWIQFEEKEFEGAANGELETTYCDGAAVWSPGQKLEELLGFDSAAPASAAVFAHWGAPPAYGLRLSPSFWEPLPRQPPNERLPTRPFSLFVQYKRPKYYDSPLDPLYQRWRQPYFRFTYSPPPRQHETLLSFEAAVRPEAEVVYAAPAFRTTWELEELQLAREIWRHTNIHNPSDGRGHSAWTYVRGGGYGVANEAGEPTEGPGIEGVVESLIARSAASRGDPLDLNIAHLRQLADATAGVFGDAFYPDYGTVFGRLFGEVDERLRRAAADTIFVARAMSFTQTDWLLIQARS
jgi:hypothetical protein